MKRYALGFYETLLAGARKVVRTEPLPAEFESDWLHVPSAMGYSFILHGVVVNDESVDAWAGPILATCMSEGVARFDLFFEAKAGDVVGLDVQNADNRCAHEFRATLMGEVRR